ncbi:hypothetical protein AMTRI_Chr04g186040 [Amborella trichopoda]
MELMDTIKRRKVNITCLLEIKWKREKVREIDGYKLLYVGNDNNRNGLVIIVDEDLKDKVVIVKRIGDRILLIKVILAEEIINIISAYALQVGLDDRILRDNYGRT